MDCNIIDVDFMRHVNTIPDKKILKHNLAYSVYSIPLPFPKTEMI